MTKKLLVIDGDELVYKAAFASQRTNYYVRVSEDNIAGPFNTKALAIEWVGDGEAEEIYSEVSPLPEEEAIFRLRQIIKTIKEDTKPDTHRIYLTGDGNFRFDVATLLPYKGNRVDTSKPVHFNLIKDYLLEELHATTVDGMEADDALSITSWTHYKRKSNWEVTIATQDKDLLMVPGMHYNPTTHELFRMSDQDARLCFYKQLITGDKTDNIPGIYGMGPAKANKLLDPLKDASNEVLVNAVIKAYADAEIDEKVSSKMPEGPWGIDRITEVARLLWMLQDKDQVWNSEDDYYEL